MKLQMDNRLLFLIIVVTSSRVCDGIRLVGKTEYQNYPRDEIVEVVRNKQNDKFLQFANDVRHLIFCPYTILLNISSAKLMVRLGLR